MKNVTLIGMKYFVVALGNPGPEYENTRHNVGRMAVASWQKAGESKATVIIPDEMMNNSGKAIKPYIKNKKDLESLVVIHDDLDLPLGSFKISFNRGAGGHRGVESVIKTLKSEAFVRVRIGLCPTTPGGKLKKPKGEEKVVNFILGKFKPAELAELKKVFKKVREAIAIIANEGKEKAMGEFNK